MPIGVVCTTMSAAQSSFRKRESSKQYAASVPSAAKSVQSASPFMRFRTPMHTEDTPLRRSPQRAARAAPPAPMRTMRFPASATPCAAKPARNPVTSVLCPVIFPSAEMTTVLTARIRCASSLSASRSGMISVLNGIVTLNPATPASRSPHTAEASASRCTGNAV